MARIKKTLTFAPDILKYITEYAKEREITFTAALERIILKNMDEEKIFTKGYEATKYKPLQEEQEENQNTENFNEDDMAVLDIFSSFPE